MSRQPTTIKDVFALIDRKSRDLNIPLEESEAWTNSRLAEAKLKYPFFGDHSYEEYLDFCMSLFDQHIAPVPQGPSQYSPVLRLLGSC